MATVTSLGFNIFSTFNASGTRDANREINQLDRNVARASSGMNTFTGRMGAAVAMAATFGPALIPIGVALTGLAGGLAAMGATAGSALGIYGVAMQGAIKQTLAMAAAGKALTPVQATFVRSVNDMKTAYNQFIQSTQNTTLQTATLVVQGLTAGFGKLAPVVKAVDPIIRSVALAFKNWMESSTGFQRFIDIIIKFGVPALRTMVAAGRDVLTVIGIGFRAFLPLINPIADALARGAENLKRWAEGGGFERFVDKVKEVAPSVIKFFKDLWDAVKNVAAAMGILAPISLRLADALLKIIAAIPPPVLAALVGGFVALKLAMSVLTPVVEGLKTVLGFSPGGLGGILRLLASGPFLIIVVLIAAFVGVVILAWQHSETFRNAVKTLWEEIQKLWKEHLQPLIETLATLFEDPSK